MDDDMHNTNDPAIDREHLDNLLRRQVEYNLMHESKRDVDLLSQAFRNLVASNGCLSSISLRVVVYRLDSCQRLLPSHCDAGGWKLIWRAAVDIFLTAISALTTSALPIVKLDIFNHFNRCSLASDEMSKVNWGAPGLAYSMSSKNSLSISLSNRFVAWTEGDEMLSSDPDENNSYWIGNYRSSDLVEAEAFDNRNFTGLADMLSLCSQLKDLDMHSYQVGRHRLKQYDYRLLRRVVESNKIATWKLDKCYLRGIVTAEDDLTAFLHKMRISDLSLDRVDLQKGTFRRIIDYCTSEEADMKHLFLNDLFETNVKLRLIFQPNNVRSRWTLERFQDNVKQPIHYLPPHPDRRALETPQMRIKYQKMNRAEYGSPY